MVQGTTNFMLVLLSLKSASNAKRQLLAPEKRLQTFLCLQQRTEHFFPGPDSEELAFGI